MEESLFHTWQSTETLEKLLDEALSTLSKDGRESIHRKYKINSNALEELMATDMHLIKIGACKCGAIFIAEDGKNVPAKGKSKAGAFITNATPVTHEGVAPPVEQIVVFAISGNHIAYIADSSNGDARLQSFFSWVFTQAEMVVLINFKNKICVDIQEAIKHHGVKKVQLSYSPNHERGEYGEAISKSLLDSLSSPIVPGSSKNPINDCAVNVIISSGTKSKNPPNLDTIKELASQMSETDLDHLTITLGDGKTITRDKLLPHDKISIPFNNGVIHAVGAMQKASEWLTSFLGHRSI